MAGDRAGSFLLGLTIGGVIGGVLAFLLAPQTGEDTRAEVRSRGIDLKERATTMVGQVKDLSRATVEDQKQRVQEALAEGREAAAKKRTDLLEQYEQAKRSGHT